MKVEIVGHRKYGAKLLYEAIVNDKETSHLFESKAEAYIFAGLYESMSINDASHLSGYISAMIKGMK